MSDLGKNKDFTKFQKSLTSVNAALVGIKLLLLTALTVAVAADLLLNLLINFDANIFSLKDVFEMASAFVLRNMRLHLTEKKYNVNVSSAAMFT